MAFPDFDDRLNEAVSLHLTDGVATYHRAGGGVITDIPYELEKSVQIYREGSELAQFIDTVILRADRLPKGISVGDEIEFNSRRYEALSIIEDDGAWRRIEIS